MGSKYSIKTTKAAPQRPPPARYAVIRGDDCINCGKCASVCLYEVHDRDENDIRRMAAPVSCLCRRCHSCVQRCTAGALSLGRSAEYEAAGDEVYLPEDVISLQEQAESGELPVSGCGYGGLFSGPGFDAMWTDMSEIVRPTRDGIHGREYISTVVDLGRKPADVSDLSFDAEGNPLSNIHPGIEIRLPVIFDSMPFMPDRAASRILPAVARAANRLRTFALIDNGDNDNELDQFRNHIIRIIDTTRISEEELLARADVESVIALPWSPRVMDQVDKLKSRNPDLIVFIRIPVASPAAGHATSGQPALRNAAPSATGAGAGTLDAAPSGTGTRAGTPYAARSGAERDGRISPDQGAPGWRPELPRRKGAGEKSAAKPPTAEGASSAEEIPALARELVLGGAGVIHLDADPYGGGFDAFPELVRRVHLELVDARVRDTVSLIASGGLSRAEHVPKTIIMGADCVAISVPALIALGCTVCGKCGIGQKCPRHLESIDMEWGSRRIINLMGSWHSQLLEILGAMGIREVSRLRGETGRVMEKRDLDREIFREIFGGGSPGPDK